MSGHPTLPADPIPWEVEERVYDFAYRPLLVRGLSDAAQSELLADLRRNPFV